jgi:hypothetical protein
MQIVYARQPLPAPGPALFLAGPTPRAGEVVSWRLRALEILEEVKFAGAVIVPEPAPGSPSTSYDDEQVFWEWLALEHATAIAFWVPRDLKTLPGFTTNVEFGLYCRSGRALLGFPAGAPKTRYLHLLARSCGVPVVHDLGELLRLAVFRASGGKGGAGR